MGAGIAQVAAQAGKRVILCDVGDAPLQAAMARIDRLLQGAVAKGRLTDADRGAVLARIRTTVDVGDMAEADFVVEAIVEDLEAKRDAFRRLDAVCREGVILASNTSSMSITEMAAATRRPDRVVGMHFFNPPQVMRLVEVVRGYYTSDATVAEARALAETLGKEAVEVRKDVPGFIVNRLLMPMIREAMLLYEEGVASMEDIDRAVVLGLNHPMGPFVLADFMGLDVDHNVMAYLAEELGNPRYAPPLILRRLLRAGRLGRKNGRGFYDYDAEGRPLPRGRQDR
ncbi:MAG: 3-hydroxyacyl-CoA dehydrogenase family protein [Clostridia bacterium]|nr:3-hydroxyacyl-CoA dehydrogenase family protein [Clostridia bacterium]